MPVVLKRPASASVQAGSSVVVTLPVAQAASKPEWYSSGDGKVQLPIYLVTAAKLVNAEDVVSEPPLRDPAKIAKQQFHDALMNSLANPVVASSKGGRPRVIAVELDTYIGVMEGTEGSQHHHAGLRFNQQKQSFLPFKLAMRQRHGLAT